MQIRTLLKKSVRPLPLDSDFIPSVVWNNNYKNMVRKGNNTVPLSISIVKGKNSIMVHNTEISADSSNLGLINMYYVERLVKTLLWIYGGYEIIIGGSREIGEFIKELFSINGKYNFDSKMMSKIFETSFKVKVMDIEKIPGPKEKSIPIGHHLNGCRIGFDLGASDRKVSAVIGGKVVFSEEVIWNPGMHTDPYYHYHEIMSMLHRAAAQMPRVDAIGGSSAGIFINNRVMIASLFKSVPDDIFKEKVKDIFLDIQKEWNVPFLVINDGEVTALAGSMSLNKNKVIGIAMGSSEAGGYINSKGNINPWINELAFIPVDFNPAAPVDDWSGDAGCGVQYFSQQAVIRLAEKAGIAQKKENSPAQKLRNIQEAMKNNDERARLIFETIGGYLGYTIAFYADFYDIETVLILGRVTSGEGGKIILQKAKEILSNEFQQLFDKIEIHLPDESNRRVGQSIAAASLPLIG
jgi:predicted NBD/HSP70 family sugar kinase